VIPPSAARALGASVALLSAVLAGCPLPQPVPAFEGAATVTPPRILTETARPGETVVRVGTDCGESAVIAFGAELDDPDLDDAVEARWFVDYSAGAPAPETTDFPPAAPDGSTTRRVLADFAYEIARRAGSSPRVVEVVVSNGFFPTGTPGLPQPNRTPQPGFETQVFRWVVVYEPGGRCQ
jgi:hypothetical protein